MFHKPGQTCIYHFRLHRPTGCSSVQHGKLQHARNWAEVYERFIYHNESYLGVLSYGPCEPFSRTSAADFGRRVRICRSRIFLSPYIQGGGFWYRCSCKILRRTDHGHFARWLSGWASLGTSQWGVGLPPFWGVFFFGPEATHPSQSVPCMSSCTKMMSTSRFSWSCVWKVWLMYSLGFIPVSFLFGVPNSHSLILLLMQRLPWM